MATQSLSKLLAGLLLIAMLTACAPAPSSAPPAAEATNASDTAAAPADTSDSSSADSAPADEPADAPAEAEAEAEGEAEASDDAQLPTGLRTYVIVPEESSASYIADEEFFGLALSKYGIPEGLVDTVGTTQAIEGQFELNWDDLSTPLGDNSFTV